MVRDNPFRQAIEYEPDTSRTVENYRTFDVTYDPSRGLTQNQRMDMHPNMSRQDLFEAGILKVADMDDEELREGRMRGRDGKIPRRGVRTGNIPADLYDEMVQEHLRRTNEKIRTQMDVALEVLVDIMTDDTNEPKDRADAAKYLFERHAGKTPERVAVAVTKAPWEEVMGGIAQVSRAQSKALREGAIDAEVVDLGVEVPPSGAQGSPDTGDAAAPGGVRRTGPSADAETRGSLGHSPSAAPTPGIQGTGRAAGPEVPDRPGPSGKSATSLGDQGPVGERPDDMYRPNPIEQLGIADAALFGDPRIPTPTPVPDYAAPEMSGATTPPVDNTGQTNAERLRENAIAAKERAERRKETRAKIQLAKKRRIVKKAMGFDAKTQPNIDMHDDGERLRFTLE